VHSLDNEKTNYKVHCKRSIQVIINGVKPNISQLCDYNYIILLLLFQVSLYAEDKFKVTSFMAQTLIAFKEDFIRSECKKPVEDLYKFSDVYKQIDHIVDVVSLKQIHYAYLQYFMTTYANAQHISTVYLGKYFKILSMTMKIFSHKLQISPVMWQDVLYFHCIILCMGH